MAQLSSKTSLHGAPAITATPYRSIAWVSDQQINPRMLKNNRSNGGVNRCFLTWFLIVCTVPSMYLQTEVRRRILTGDESLLKNYSGLTVNG